ncbi:DUF4383 domain-containing protein [Actinomycetospora sp. NBRC 106375]|uniref:DUF4383 domain-containing protein n=1 Tax=Actinomycetospora sp. NBRC 106375 TaxID=3032207 RepID=UPI002556DF4A|nr:DUF4383 domain-containing protein [Actinomycetospora sp. NBRC 106375]
MRRVHRLGAGLLGAALTAFGVMGFARGLPFLSVDGPALMGMGSNGLLATISVVVGLVLVAAAWRGGAVASTTMTTLGVLFLVSGLANLAVLGTAANLLAFRFPNVVFSLLAGMALLFTGAYGRISGGLPSENPYARARAGDQAPDQESSRLRILEIDEMAAAENATSNGVATPEQAALVRADRIERAEAHRRRSHEHAERAR